MNADLSLTAGLARPTRVRYGVLGFACALSMITYLDRVCMSTVAPFIHHEFHLTDLQLGWLFSAFTLAYSLFEVPTGWLGDIFGARRTLIRIVLWWSVFTALTGVIYPNVAWPGLGFVALLLVRFFFGIGEAGAYPNIARALANWFPFAERGSAQGAVWMAGRLAGLSPLIVLAMMYNTPTANGETITHWRHSFWIFGVIGATWCLAFWFWFRERPEQHPAVNAAELAWIHGAPAISLPILPATPHPRPPSTDVTAGRGEGVEASAVVGASGEARLETKPVAAAHPEASHHNVPWKALLKDGNLWFLCLMYFCGAYGWYFNITWLPKYLSTELKVTRETHGLYVTSLLSGAPLLVGSLACLVGGLLTDWFIRVTGDRKWGRRLFGMIGHGICALCYFLTLTTSSPWLFVLYLALAAFWNDLTMGAAWASCIDIGGKYAGIVSGCMNTVGNFGGFLAAPATGLALHYFGSKTGYTVSLVSFGLAYVVAVFLWLRFDATKPVAQS